MLARLFILTLFACGNLHTADAWGRTIPTRIDFAPLLNGMPLHEACLEKSAGDSLHITTFRFYVSGISLWQGERVLWQEPNSFHLVDAEIPASLSLNVDVPPGLEFSSLHFLLGVDSATSNNGAHGGDLDPARGMYWAWQSGYINLKLEGIYPGCPTRGHEFQFHLGGYQSPFTAAQEIKLKLKPSEEIKIVVDLTEFLSQIDLRTQYSIMIPGKEAVALSQKIAGIFHITYR